VKFTIVTISYNQVEFLKRCIDSVLSQKGVDVEYVVMDPGSNDGSRELISGYADRIQKVVFEKDQGPADGLNRGFSEGSGDIFGFLNSDDELIPGALLKIQEAFKRNPQADMISGCGYFVDARGDILKTIVPSKFSPWLYLNGAVTVFQQGTFFTRRIYEKAGGFNRENRTCWDGELFLDMALAGAVHHTIGDDIALFRLHGGSITGSGRLNEKYALDIARLYQKASGKNFKHASRLERIVARIAKSVLDPAYLLRRLKRSVGGQKAVWQ
jgi:glycosyltransferase involved in cell wall biosynthesis